MNKLMKVCAFVLVSANLFQTTVFAQGQNRSPYARGWNQMSNEQRTDINQMRQREQLNSGDEQGNMQGWGEYNQRWNPSYNEQGNMQGQSDFNQR